MSDEPGAPGSSSRAIVRAALTLGWGMGDPICTCGKEEGKPHHPDCQVAKEAREFCRLLESELDGRK
jgi:hypothetical protein